MAPCVENEASPSTNSALRTPRARARRHCVFVFAEDRGGRNFANWNARERNHIACVEVSFTVCTVAGCRCYQRECGACGENCYFGGARTKHHLGFVPTLRPACLSPRLLLRGSVLLRCLLRCSVLSPIRCALLYGRT